MTIFLDPEAELKLTAWWVASNQMEYSGLGDVVRVGKDFQVANVNLLDVGSWGFTIFPAAKIMELPRSQNRRLWFHRHPVGDGLPGPQNWSGTDNHTAEREPCGTLPELIQWSVSIVRTPRLGWTGRLDIYVPKLITYYLPVEPHLPTAKTLKAATKLAKSYRDIVAELMRNHEAMVHPAHQWEYEDWDDEDLGQEDMLFEQELLFKEEQERLGDHTKLFPNEFEKKAPAIYPMQATLGGWEYLKQQEGAEQAMNTRKAVAASKRDIKNHIKPISWLKDEE